MPATKAARNRMSGLRRFLSPLKATLRAVHPPPSPPLSGVSGCGISELLKVLPKPAYHISQTNALIVARVLQRKISQGLNLSGKKVPVGNFLGLSISTWLIAQQATVIYAVDTNYEGMEETSGVLKDDLRSLWSLARKFQLPAVLFVTVLLGWRHPFVLFINVALLLFCTRPSPLSIYVFIEQLRQSDMRRDPSLRKTKFLYVKNVEIEDYRMFCLAKVELRDVKLNVIGILGGWWIVQTSPSCRP